jgi:hypothetical protein
MKGQGPWNGLFDPYILRALCQKGILTKDGFKIDLIHIPVWFDKCALLVFILPNVTVSLCRAASA